ncbi:MAG: hypothetical protein ACJAUR_001844 [Ulvibacter sp.]|jgi:hypothetical protein
MRDTLPYKRSIGIMINKYLLLIHLRSIWQPQITKHRNAQFTYPPSRIAKT